MRPEAGERVRRELITAIAMTMQEAGVSAAPDAITVRWIAGRRFRVELPRVPGLTDEPRTYHVDLTGEEVELP